MYKHDPTCQGWVERAYEDLFVSVSVCTCVCVNCFACMLICLWVCFVFCVYAHVPLYVQCACMVSLAFRLSYSEWNQARRSKACTGVRTCAPTKVPAADLHSRLHTITCVYFFGTLSSCITTFLRTLAGHVNDEIQITVPPLTHQPKVRHTMCVCVWVYLRVCMCVWVFVSNIQMLKLRLDIFCYFQYLLLLLVIEHARLSSLLSLVKAPVLNAPYCDHQTKPTPRTAPYPQIYSHWVANCWYKEFEPVGVWTGNKVLVFPSCLRRIPLSIKLHTQSNTHTYTHRCSGISVFSASAPLRARLPYPQIITGISWYVHGSASNACLPLPFLTLLLLPGAHVGIICVSYKSAYV